MRRRLKERDVRFDPVSIEMAEQLHKLSFGTAHTVDTIHQVEDFHAFRTMNHQTLHIAPLAWSKRPASGSLVTENFL